MGSKSYFILIPQWNSLIFVPTISFTQSPITEQPSLGQQQLNEQSGFAGNSNQTLPSGLGNPNST
jgi:hypothetical protein